METKRAWRAERLGVVLGVVFSLIVAEVTWVAADDNAAANKIFVETVQLLNQAASAQPSEAIKLYEKALQNLDRIVANYPSSTLAVQLISGQAIGKIHRGDIEKALLAARYAGSFYEMLKLVPALPQTRHEVTINDYARIRELYNIPLLDPEASEKDRQLYIEAIGSAVPDSSSSFGIAAFISGFPYARASPIRREKIGFGVQDVDLDIQARQGLEEFEAIRGRIDPSAIEGAMSRCASCPVSIRDTYEGCKIYDWGRDPHMTNVKQRLALPAFDNLGRLRPLGIQKPYVFRALAPADIKLMCDTSRGKLPSLADEEDFRVLAQGMASLGAYSVVFRGNPQEFMEQTPKQLPLLRRYQAYGWGIGKDDHGQYMALILVHTEEGTVRENVQLLRRRIAETSGLKKNRPWSVLVDSVEMRAEGRGLLAKLRGLITLNWLAWTDDTLLLCE